MNVCVFVLVWLCVWCLTLLRSSILKQVGPRITQALRGSHPLRLGLVGSLALLSSPLTTALNPLTWGFKEWDPCAVRDFLWV